MKLIVKKGRTSLMVKLFIQDSSSTSGAGLTGLSSASGSLVCYRARDDDGNAGGTVISLTSTGTLGTWASGWFKEKDSANMPGVYEFGVPDNAIASGSETCVIMFKGATNMVPCVLEIQLVAYDPQDATALGLSRIDAAISSRQATVTFPTNFSTLSIDGSGRVDISKVSGTTQTAADLANIPTTLLDLSAGVETGVTLRQWLRLAGAALFGKSSGLDSTSALYRDFNDTKNRISATVDGFGNRSAVTRDST